MYDFLAFFIICVLGMSLSVILKCKLGKTLPLSVLSIIAFLYSFALIDGLGIGLKLIIILFIASIIYVVRNYKIVIEQFDFPVMCYLLCMLGIFLFHHRFSKAHTWDELAQWAVTVKWTYFTDTLAANQMSNSMYPDYPPASGLFHYFWMHIGTQWHDHRLYISMCMLIVVFFSPFFSRMFASANSIKNVLVCILVEVAVTILPMSIYPALYNSLTVDGLIAIIFAYLMYNILIEDQPIVRCFAFSLGGYVLVAVKKSAIIFALFALLLYFVRIKRESLCEKQYIISGLLMSALSKIFWINYVKEKNITKTFPMISRNMFNLSDWQKKGFANYYKAIFNYAILGGEKTSQTIYYVNRFKIATIAVILLLTIGVVFIKNIRGKAYGNYLIIVFIEMIIYIIMTSYLYIYSFGEGEVDILSSMNRYLGSFLLGFLLIELYIILDIIKLQINKSLFFLLFLIMVAHVDTEHMFLYSCLEKYKDNIESIAANYLDCEKKAKFIKENMDSSATRVHVFNGDIAYINYALTPIAVKTPLWTSGDFGYFGQFYYDYDYVWLDNSYGTVEDRDFINKYGYYFMDSSEIMDLGLYHVEYNNGQPVLRFINSYTE